MNQKSKSALQYGVKRFIIAFILILVIYFSILYLIFFVIDRHTIITGYAVNMAPSFKSLQEIQGNRFLIYTSSEKNSTAEPINLIFITDKNLTDYFAKINWLNVPKITDKNVTVRSLIKSIRQADLPVSEMYYEGRTQDMSFQNKSGENLVREHIRIWEIGQYNNPDSKVYFAAASIDEGIKFAVMHDFIVPTHKIDPNVDAERTSILKLFQSFDLVKNYTCLEGKTNISRGNQKAHYITDGKILVLFLK